jgi:hypothetical protein
MPMLMNSIPNTPTSLCNSVQTQERSFQDRVSGAGSKRDRKEKKGNAYAVLGSHVSKEDEDAVEGAHGDTKGEHKQQKVAVTK